MQKTKWTPLSLTLGSLFVALTAVGATNRLPSVKLKGVHFVLTLGSLFVALTAVGANITSIAPFMVVGGVPITLQTFFAILAGTVLGSRLGAFSMFVYMMLGLAGAPVFAQFKGGVAITLFPKIG